MKHILFLIGIIFLVDTSLVWAQRPVPAPKQQGKIAIVGAKIHVGNGEVIENGTVVFDNGKITAVGKEANVDGAEIIKVEGKHLYPAFISVNNQLGLVETESVKATVDFREQGDFNPEVRTLVAFNTDSHVIPTIRTNGILYTQPVLKGGVLNGTSSIMNLDGWNWEDAVLAKDNVLHIEWPADRSTERSTWEDEKEQSRGEKLKNMETYFKRAKKYKKGGEKDFKLEAIAEVYQEIKPVFIKVSGAKEALEVIQFFKENEIENGVILGDESLVLVLDEIAESGVGLILERLHKLPYQVDAVPNATYGFAKKVADKNILFGLDYSGDMEYMGVRNLPFVAGTAVAHGLDYEQAVGAISLNLAKLLKVDDKIGSIEVGKNASFFISDGDALDPLTNNVIYAFIDGRSISLNNKQKELYQQYKKKYENATLY